MAAIYVILVWLAFTKPTLAAAPKRNSKLRIQTDNNVATELRNLKSAVTAIRTELYDVMDDNKRLRRNLRDVMTETKQLSMANLRIKDDIKEATMSAASLYVRWGKASCSNGTQTVYSGYMAGQDSGTKSSGANPLCLPSDPTWANFNDAKQSSYRGHIAGTEYEDVDNLLGRNIAQKDAPCALCQTPRLTNAMFPARTGCYPGWSLEYSGYLMSGHNGLGSPTEYVCVDGRPDFVRGGGMDTNGHQIYPVEVLCGTLPCPPYMNHRELACAVCSL